MIDALVESTGTTDLLRYSRALADISITREQIEQEISDAERIRPYIGEPTRLRGRS